VCFVLAPTGAATRFVYAYFVPAAQPTFLVLQLQLQVSNAQSFTGEVTFLAPTDQVITTGVFSAGKLVASTAPAAAVSTGRIVNTTADFWGCVGRCLHDTYHRLPWFIQIGCEVVCGGCFANPLACAACIGCLGGYASACVTWALINC
jgi:hypothetical protein